MKILISPAKKMRSDPDTLAPEALPALLPETERLLAAVRTGGLKEKALNLLAELKQDLNGD